MATEYVSVAMCVSGSRAESGQREEPDPAVVFLAQLVGVTADPQSGRGGHERLDTVPAGPGGVPGERLALERVERGDALPRDRAGSGEVTAEGVVLPALVTAHVDRGAGDRD